MHVMQLEGSVSGGGTVAKAASEYQIHVEGAVATAFAEALARAKSHYGEAECVAWADSNGCVENSCFECQATSVSSSSIKEINAIAEASALLQHTTFKRLYSPHVPINATYSRTNSWEQVKVIMLHGILGILQLVRLLWCLFARASCLVFLTVLLCWWHVPFVGCV